MRHAPTPRGYKREVLLEVFHPRNGRRGFGYRPWLIWLKQVFVLGRSDYHYRHELFLCGWLDDGPHYFTDDRTHESILEVNQPFVGDLHPTTKPIELIAELTSNISRAGEAIYNPFSGIGSTMIERRWRLTNNIVSRLRGHIR
jgi:DNA modification methylase